MVYIEDNTIRDNRYGITTIGSVDAIIRNNTMIDNCYENIPANGGSCISVYDISSSSNVYIEGNWMEGGLWGITIVSGEPNVNLGKTEDPTAEDYNPGNNTFINNGNNGVLYDLFNNGTGTVWAQGNTWNVDEQTEEKIEEVIFHQVDDPSKGLVIFMPAHDPNTAVEEISAAQQGDGLYYNLMGIPTENPTSGIYIHDGKKVLVK